MIDFVHIVIVMAAVSGPAGKWQEPQSAHKRGFTQAECAAAVQAIPVGAKTTRGDLILVSMCAPAVAPDADKEEVHPDPRNKGAI